MWRRRPSPARDKSACGGTLRGFLRQLCCRFFHPEERGQSHLNLTIFASGSTGNCALVTAGDTRILVDAGISARRIEACLAHWNVSLATLTGVVITHPHRDHIGGLEVLIKHANFPIYATAPAARQLCYRLPIDHRIHTFQAREPFSLGELTVLGIPTRHDAPGSVGYRFTESGGKSACIVTDLGVVTPAVEEGVAGCSVAVIECNHDPDCLRDGPYPYPLQKRVAGPEGHLCNEDGAALCALAVQAGAHTVTLAHLSQQNNSPDLARAAVEQALAGFDARIEVAPVFCEGLRLEV